MARTSAREPEAADAAGVDSVRLARADRRGVLLDAAAELVAAGDVEAVSMEAVAERAGVSRPLVYKHFANRSDLLAAVYQRESALLHAELTTDVSAAETLEETFRALIHGALRAQASRGATFAALRAAGLRTRARREEQRQRVRPRSPTGEGGRRHSPRRHRRGTGPVAGAPDARPRRASRGHLRVAGNGRPRATLA